MEKMPLCMKVGFCSLDSWRRRNFPLRKLIFRNGAFLKKNPIEFRVMSMEKPISIMDVGF